MQKEMFGLFYGITTVFKFRLFRQLVILRRCTNTTVKKRRTINGHYKGMWSKMVGSRTINSISLFRGDADHWITLRHFTTADVSL
jgi:hypothetical protein